MDKKYRDRVTEAMQKLEQNGGQVKYNLRILESDKTEFCLHWTQLSVLSFSFLFLK